MMYRNSKVYCGALLEICSCLRLSKIELADIINTTLDDVVIIYMYNITPFVLM